MIPYYQWTTIELGPLTFQVWGLFVALGMLLGLLILYKRENNDNSKKETLDLAIWILFGGIIFARLFHIFFYEPIFFLSNPLEIFMIWHGGMSSFGGLFGAVIGFYWFSKKKKIVKDRLIIIADKLSFASLFGWIIGRIGCFVTHLHPGRLSDSFLSVKFPGGPRLDMAVIEILFLIPLTLAFIILRKKNLFKGFYISSILIYYGILRFILDFYRATDIARADARYFGLTPAQYFGILIAVVGIVVLTGRERKK